ncbi:uncharacterized protein LOC135847417 [Planococcus citri]|uniref:uncharacterized protein LOC135847417 n=1 Tax=Planococcus citri TaxID=170843 RepID=UPI0031F72D6D
MSEDDMMNFHQGFNAIEHDFLAPDELPDSTLNDSSAHQIKILDGNSCNEVGTAHIDLEDRSTYVYAHAQQIPRLQDMATLVATLETLNNHYCHSQSKPLFYDFPRNTNPEIDNLMVPNRIKEKMKALCAKMEKEEYFLKCADIEGKHRPNILRLRSVYDNDSDFYLYGLVWDVNGHIDHKKTIEKAISRSRHLNNGDFIFEIITAYCLKNHIMDFPLDSLSKKFIRTVKENRFVATQLTYYWINWMKCKRKINLERYDHASYELALISLLGSLKWCFCQAHQWPVYEYFWDVFDENEQVTVTKNLIRRGSINKNFQMFLFSKLNKKQLKQLYSEGPLTIIANFLSLGEFDLAKATWDRIKLTIACEKYELLLEQIWKNRKSDEDGYVQFLIYLWNTAPPNLIEYMIEVKNCQITDKFLKGKPMLESSSGCKFLKAVLSRTTPEFKQKFLLQAGPCLTLNHPEVLISLTNHCLNDTDRVAVKESLLIEAMESSPPAGIMHRFRDLFLYSSPEEFNKFLELFTLKPTLQTRFKECLLRSKLLITRVLWRTNDWEKLSHFIDELYPNREVARYQKRNVVFTFLQTYCTYHDCYRPNGDEKFTEIDNLVNQVLTPREVITAKENIANSFLERCRSGRVRSTKRMNMLRFATWCYCGDEEKIKRFRRLLPIDKLFHALLSEIVERYVNGRDAKLSFSSLDELLHWKFSSRRRKMKKFKSRKINKIMKSKVEVGYSWKTNVYPPVVKKVIKWFFHDDRRQIREFEQRYSKRDLMKIIYWMNLREESDGCGEYYGHTSLESDGGRIQRSFVRTNDESDPEWHLPNYENDVFHEFGIPLLFDSTAEESDSTTDSD